MFLNYNNIKVKNYADGVCKFNFFFLQLIIIFLFFLFKKNLCKGGDGEVGTVHFYWIVQLYVLLNYSLSFDYIISISRFGSQCKKLYLTFFKEKKNTSRDLH